MGFSPAQGSAAAGLALSGDQGVSGTKTFQDARGISVTPIASLSFATKEYVDSGVGTGAPSGAAGGDLTGTYPNPTIVNGYVDLSSNQTVSGTKTFHSIQGAGSPINDKDLATKEYVDASDGPPSGPAGGDLAGTYPNPTIALTAISGNKIADGAVLQGHVANGYVDLSSTQIVSGNKTFHRPKAAGNPIDSEDLATKNYVDTCPSTPSGPAGGDLDGTYPDPTIALTAVSGNKIADGAVLQGHVANGYVDLSSDQTVSGTKTFLRPVAAGSPTNDKDLATKEYVDNTSSTPSGAAGGDLEGTYPNPTIALTAVSGNKIADGAILQSHVENGYVDLSSDQTVSGTKTFSRPKAAGSPIDGTDLATKDYVDASVGPPSGPAGGDLDGTYPDPTIALTAVSGNKIADGAVLQSHVANGYVDLSSDQTVSGTKTFHQPVAAGNPINDKDLATKEYVDTCPSTPSGPAGGDLAGTYPNPTIELAAVSGNKIADGAVLQGHLANNSVGSNQIINGSVANADLQDGAVSGSKVTDGSILQSHVDNGYVDLSSDQTVSGTKTLHGAKASGDPTDSDDLATKNYVDNTSATPSGAAGGDLAGTYPNPTVGLATISGNKIADGAVLQGHVANGYVDLSSDQTVSGIKTFLRPVAAGSPTNDKDLATKEYVDASIGPPSGPAGGDLDGTYPDPTIALTAVSGNKIADGAVLQGHMADNSVGSAQIINGSIANAELQDNAVSGSKIADGAVLQSHVANGYVDLSSNQTVSGTKTFSRPKAAGNPIDSEDLATKNYVDNTSSTPSGAAGGDLDGTYPNPTIALTAVSGNKIADGAILQSHVENGYVDLSSAQTISGDKTFHRPKAAGSPIDGTDLTTKDYVDASVGPPSGAAGGDLDGTYPNPTIALTAVSGNKIADGTVLQSHVANGYVDLSSDQTVSGTKTFLRPVAAGSPTNDKDLATKEYVDNTSATPSGAAGGDLDGTYPNPTIALTAVSGSKIADGAVLQSHVTNGYVDLSSNQTVSGTKTLHGAKASGDPTDSDDLATKNYVDNTSSTPSGAAGGDLTGTYPNPTLGNLVVSGNKIADGAVLQSHVANGYVDLSSNQTVSGTKTFSRPKAAGNPIDNEDLATKEYVDSGVGTGSPSGAAGGDLTGNYPNPTIANGYVDLSSDQTVSGIKTFLRPVAAGSPTNDKDLATKEYVDNTPSAPSGAAGGDLDGTYPNPTIALTAVSGNKIQANSILQGHLANNSVGSDQIVNGSIANADFQDGAVSGSKITDGSVYPSHLERGYVDFSSVQTVSGTKTFLKAVGAGNPIDGTDLATKDYVDGISAPPSGAAGGDLDGTYPNPTIALTAVSGNKIADGSIYPSHLERGYVDFSSVQTVSGTKTFYSVQGAGNPINDKDLATKEYVDASVGPPSGAAGGDLDGTYPNPTIALTAVSGNKIADGSILQGHVANGYVDLSSNQTVSGTKTFSRPKAAGSPIDGTDLATKDYVDGISAPPSGAAGGDLDGTYPNPTIALTAVSGNKIADGAILQSHVANGYVDLSSNQTVSGTKTFSRPKAAGNPIDSEDLVTKSYSDGIVTAIPHTWAVSDAISVTSGSGASDFISPFFIPIGSNEKVELAKAIYKINAGSQATVKIQRNDADVTGFTGINVQRDKATTDPANVELTDEDKLALLVTTVSGSPTDLSFTVVLEHSRA